MKIGVVATLTVQEGHGAEFEAAFKSLAEQVNANEPGALFYALHKSRTEPGVYKVLEQYTNEAALQAHGQTEYFKAAGKVLAPFMAAAPHVEYFDAV